MYSRSPIVCMITKKRNGVKMENMMRYTNPVIKGFYPDPSVCRANGKYYLACSSFQYFPGVPIFESIDLVNWKQIGHALTKKEQVMLDGVRSSGGIFAPTLRWCGGRFFMTANNNSTNENFGVFQTELTKYKKRSTQSLSMLK